MPAGVAAEVLGLIARTKARVTRRLGTTPRVACCYEAGRDGFWLHRVLEAEGIASHVMDPTSLQVDRRARRAKTDRLDAQALLRALMAWSRGERQVCSMVRPPSPEHEDERRLSRERGTLLKERLMAMLSGFFALVSLALTAIGLYGVLSYSVVQRTREIGIRLALGARQRTVVVQVLRGVAAYGLVGIAVGVAGGLYASRFLKTLLYEVDALDPASLLVPVVGFLVVGAIAAIVPARRAASVDPIVALRDE